MNISNPVPLSPLTPSTALPFAVAILAAGASVRMGQPKMLLPWEETTVIGHTVNCWRKLGAAQIGIVLGPKTALGPELDRIGLPPENRILNPNPDRGMFSSIQTAAAWGGWNPVVQSFVVALGDQPQLSTATLQTLLDFHQRQPDAISRPSYRGRGRHPVILPRVAWNQLPASSAPTLKDFLASTSFPLVECPIEDARLTLDLDTPGDYKNLIVLNRTIDT